MTGWQAFALGLLTAAAPLALWWLRDRRKDRAAAAVAERTVSAEVATRDIGAYQAELAYVRQTFDAERESRDRQIANRDAEIERLRGELSHRDQMIAALRDQVADLEEQLARVTRQLNRVRVQLNDLADPESAPTA